MNPLVSVVMPTYNQEKYIAQAIEGVLAQDTNFPIELLIGEDESSDNTRLICLDYAARFPNMITIIPGKRKDVIYIRGQATGRANMLRLLKAARGKYVAFCEGDDYWTDPQKLQLQVEYLEENNTYSGACHLTPCIDQNGEIVRILGDGKGPDMDVAATIDKASPFHTSSFVFRKSALPSPWPRWFKKIMSADMCMFTLVALHGKIRLFPKAMSIYRRHSAGLTQQPGMVEDWRNQQLDYLKHLKAYLPIEYRTKVDAVANFHKLKLKENCEGTSLVSRIKTTFNIDEN